LTLIIGRQRTGSVKDCQGDREGRPYNTKLPVLHVTVYCTGDPRGRPGNVGSRDIPFLAIFHSP